MIYGRYSITDTKGCLIKTIDFVGKSTSKLLHYCKNILMFEIVLSFLAIYIGLNSK